MFYTTADYPADWPDARIYILSDLHIGDSQSDPAQVQERIDRIANDPHGLCVLNGDLLNTATRNSISDIYSEVLPPMEQIRLAVGMLRPIAKKIIAADTGNHEHRVYKADGVDMMRLVCRELGVEKRYSPEGVLCFLRFGQKTPHEHGRGKRCGKLLYVIYATHGTGGGRKEGAKAIRLADMANIVDADIYIHSHTHLPMSLRQAYHRVDTRNHVVIKVDKLFVNDAASLKYGGYGQAGEFKPSSMCSPVIHLGGVNKTMNVMM